MSTDLSFLDSLSLDGRISRGSSDRTEHASDWQTRDVGIEPDVVVFAHSTEDVSRVLAAANDRSIPVTPYAAGTGLEGGALPLQKGISLDLTGLNEIRSIRPADQQITVGAGVIGSDLNDAVAKHGLYLPPLPASGSISTVGGMIATDASGMQTVKYGEVADWLLDVEVVLADGRVTTFGSKARKTSSGYNLKELVVGSEGTLCVITAATFRLAGRPAQIRRGRAVFETLSDATAAIADAITSGVDVATIELMDSDATMLVNAHSETDLPEVPMVFVEFHANHHIEEEIEFCQSIFASHNLREFDLPESEREMDAIWEARENITYAAAEWKPHLRESEPGDVTVPISAYGPLVDRVKEIAQEHDLLIPCFGHAGDGNLHYFALLNPDDPEMVARSDAAYEEIVEAAIKLDGTATGEHGIGIGKQKFMEQEHGSVSIDVMRSIKDAFDPNGILNPGKVLPPVND
ncbi:FAD-binding oxidoreductase [Natronocalculus amylovorans]|uniref:D-lactate dehydrogenase (cytochrome) n=1 Tax=Natronocalculus amylovorans TaxID=2917812 RepID=A0AAE3FWJ9_9EURY|nr:FAD-binding oxidoreductase [Natronocalculus amylovorans]MCL9816480.1 FAD-binding oxidoreductase [Natronocalculus amylovorans]